MRCAASSSERAWSSRSLTFWLSEILSFSRVQSAGQLRRLFFEIREFAFQCLQPLSRRIVIFLAERLAFDLELDNAPVELVDFLRLGIDRHAKAGGGLVDEVDRLVRQKPVGDVTVGERGRRDDGAVGDPDAVVEFVFLLEPTKNRDRIGDRGLGDEDRLEAPGERRVLLDVLAVLVERCRADAVKLAAREHRLEHVGGVHRPLRRAGTDERV